jgi:hypothetical protein
MQYEQRLLAALSGEDRAILDALLSRLSVGSGGCSDVAS